MNSFNAGYRRARLAWRVLCVLLATAALPLIGTGVANAEAFHTSTMNKSWTPWTTPHSQGAQYWTVGSGTTVSMRCWNTGVERDGTSKWFYIRSEAYPFTEGYVPANSVSRQWLSSPHC